MGTYTHDEVLGDSLRYFDGDDVAANVFVDKYALRDSNGDFVETSPINMHSRIARELHRIESKYPNPMDLETIFAMLKGFKYIIPQGSGMFGIGNKHQTVSLSNCYVLSKLEDSYSSILDVDKELVNISKRRGGCGIDLTPLRPDSSPVTNAARSSTGVGPFMERYSNSTREVGQNNRRGALMLTLDVRHPDIRTFVTIKNDPKKVTGANISVRLTDEFMEAVQNDGDFALRFPVEDGPVHETIRARELWDLIVQQARDMAEPGLLFWDRILSESPADCYDAFQTISTNPCSELPLSALDSCRLMVLNLYSMVDDPFTPEACVNFERLQKTSHVLQRLMDDMIDLELEAVERIIEKIRKDPESEDVKASEIKLWTTIYENCQKGRRSGSGITGLGDMLAACGVAYGSDEALKLVDEVFKVFKIGCYQSSVNLAKERGAFLCWDYDKEKDNAFLRRLYDESGSEGKQLEEDTQKYGRRNISLLTIAPTGSVSLLCRCSSGVEPVFSLSHTRRRKIDAKHSNNARVDFVDQMGDAWTNYEVFHPTVNQWKAVTGKTDVTESPWFGSTASEIGWEGRVSMQGIINRHIDHSISSTINLPSDVDVATVENIYFAAWKQGCKGMTIYRDGSRTGVLITDDTPTDKIQKTTAPKRPKELPCHVHHMTLRGCKYIVVVGLYKRDPYEIFVFKNYTEDGDVYIPKCVDEGAIFKKKRGQYILKHYCLDGSSLEYDLGKAMNDENLDVITRMLSCNLRHGADIAFIVHQLEKSFGSIASFSKILARALKKYIADGTNVTGEECPECSADLRRYDGCISCVNCGYTKCM